MAVRTYDPKQVIITVGGVPMSGFADGSFLTIDRDDNQWTKVTGADGTSTRIKSNNRSGNMTITPKAVKPEQRRAFRLCQCRRAHKCGRRSDFGQRPKRQLYLF